MAAGSPFKQKNPTVIAINRTITQTQILLGLEDIPIAGWRTSLYGVSFSMMIEFYI